MKTKDQFEKLLLALITRADQGEYTPESTDREAEIVFSRTSATEMSSQKMKALLDTLTEHLSQDTLGSLITHALVTSNIPTQELQLQTGLTPSLLDAIKSDLVFTNSIPVKSLTRLLKLLRINLESAMSGIETTFNKLTVENKMLLTVPEKIRPAFRKGSLHKDMTEDLKKIKSDESYLWQNKDALDKYTTRLTELYQQV